MRVAIYGAGSIGTILGAYLTKSGVDVDLVSRNRAHVAALKEKGATVTGTVSLSVPVKALLPDEMSGKYDLVFLLTKQLDNARTVAEFLPNLADDGIVCTMQNGLPEPSVAEVVGGGRTFGCSIAWGATMVGPGVCELTSEPDSLTFGLGTFDPDANRDKLTAIARLLERMGPVAIERNFIGARWSKLLVNSAFSGMSAVLGCTFGEAARAKASRRCIQRIIKECIDVAAASRVVIEPIQGKDIRRLLDYRNPVKEWLSFALIPLVIAKHRLLKASMLQDLEKGRRTEVDAINGVVCLYGRQVNVPTPYNDMVCAIVHDIENGQKKPDVNNVLLFTALR